MTTVAYDGTTMVADKLAVDSWGLTEVATKIYYNDHVMIGGAGEGGQILQWINNVLKPEVTTDDLLKVGYAPYVKDSNDPSLLLVDRRSGDAYRHAGGWFIPVSRKFHAVGSGRDYALAAMHLGLTAKDAVLVAAQFDNNTGNELQIVHCHAREQE